MGLGKSLTTLLLVMAPTDLEQRRVSIAPRQLPAGALHLQVDCSQHTLLTPPPSHRNPFSADLDLDFIIGHSYVKDGADPMVS